MGGLGKTLRVLTGARVSPRWAGPSTGAPPGMCHTLRAWRRAAGGAPLAPSGSRARGRAACDVLPPRARRP